MYSIVFLVISLVPVQAAPAPAPVDYYSQAVSDFKKTGKHFAYFFVGIRTEEKYVPAYEVQPIGDLKAGEVWKVWFEETGNLVGERIRPAPQRMPNPPIIYYSTFCRT